MSSEIIVAKSTLFVAALLGTHVPTLGPALSLPSAVV